MYTKSARRQWYILLLFLLAAFLVGNFLLPKDSVSYTVKDDKLQIFCCVSQGFEQKTVYSFTIPLDELESYVLTDSDPDTVLLDGAETSSCLAGLMESGRYGAFEGCLCRKSGQVVLMKTIDGSLYLVSLENDANTGGFFEGLEHLMENYKV